MGSVRTSIFRETSTPTRPPTRSDNYTLDREEPHISTSAVAAVRLAEASSTPGCNSSREA